MLVLVLSLMINMRPCSSSHRQVRSARATALRSHWILGALIFASHHVLPLVSSAPQGVSSTSPPPAPPPPPQQPAASGGPAPPKSGGGGGDDDVKVGGPATAGPIPNFTGDGPFFCAPPTASADKEYSEWTIHERIYFAVCWEMTPNLTEVLLANTFQQEIDRDCDPNEPNWDKVMPGPGNTDFHDDFHEDVIVPPEYYPEIEEGEWVEFPRAVKLLNDQGFKFVKKLLSGKNIPFCATLIPEHMPMECVLGKCWCNTYIHRLTNEYTVHFTKFRDKPKPPVVLEYDHTRQLCTFPQAGECMVQPNENTDGYQIPCYDQGENCLIFGNDFECNYDNVMRTIERYNRYASGIKDKLNPFRMDFPIQCFCSDNELKEGELPESGIYLSALHMHFDLNDQEDNEEAGGDDDESQFYAMFKGAPVEEHFHEGGKRKEHHHDTVEASSASLVRSRNLSWLLLLLHATSRHFGWRTYMSSIRLISLVLLFALAWLNDCDVLAIKRKNLL